MSGPRITRPSVSSSDPNFRYRRSEATDIRKTFARVKREQARAAREDDQGQQRLDLDLAPGDGAADAHTAALRLFSRIRATSDERADD